MDKKTETLLVIVLACIALYLVKHYTFMPVVALGVGLAGLLVPGVKDALHFCWMKLAEGMGWVSGKILLTVIYFLVLVPLALVARARGKVSLRMKAGGGSYFRDREHEYKKEDLVHPW